VRKIPVEPTKKPYENQALRVYGAVRTVTKATLASMSNDGMAAKTH
jgi:hypothetical protein